MFGIGTQEILLILAVALIVMGPKKLPEIARALGRGLRELQNALHHAEDTPAPFPSPDTDVPADESATKHMDDQDKTGTPS